MRHAHGLTRKRPRSHTYDVASQGRKILSAILASHQLIIESIPLLGAWTVSSREEKELRQCNTTRPGGRTRAVYAFYKNKSKYALLSAGRITFGLKLFGH